LPGWQQHTLPSRPRPKRKSKPGRERRLKGKQKENNHEQLKIKKSRAIHPALFIADKKPPWLSTKIDGQKDPVFENCSKDLTFFILQLSLFIPPKYSFDQYHPTCYN
jgi:hypothetical protein